MNSVPGKGVTARPRPPAPLLPRCNCGVCAEGPALSLSPHVLPWFSFLLDALYLYTGGNFTVTGPNATAGFFATYPAPYMSLTGAFFNEVSP